MTSSSGKPLITPKSEETLGWTWGWNQVGAGTRMMGCLVEVVLVEGYNFYTEMWC